jgi:hypothetical protein
MASQTETKTGRGLPGWVPEHAQHYLAHIENGLPIRVLARQAGCHASTILRQVRRIEALRDDPLVDAVLRRLGQHQKTAAKYPTDGDKSAMTSHATFTHSDIDEAKLTREARRILRRLCEPGAVLAIAAEMDKAVVVRDTGAGGATRTGVVDNAIAQAMALKDWISCATPGRISRYRITALGRSALNRVIADQENRVRGFAETQTGFDTGRDMSAALEDEDDHPHRRKTRFALSDSPLAALARRRDKDGTPFLSDALVSAGERLREDFELAQMGPRVTQNWEQFLTAGVVAGGSPNAARGPEGARARVAQVMQDVGPGLSEIALRCCCHLEGLETAEKRMGWSARSGKIVLRIALQRLREHYERTDRR